MTSQNSPLSRTAMALWRKRHPGVSFDHPEREIPHLDIPLRSLPRLAVDQTTNLITKRRGPKDVPWITPDAIKMLSVALRPTDVGLEFGSGGSTVWLAKHSGKVMSVEAFEQWYEALRARIEREHIDNATVTLASAKELVYESPEHHAAYVNAYPELAPGSLDWVFVDGEYRDETAMRAIQLLKSGGLLILDNANSYLPAPSRTPWRVNAPASPLWDEFVAAVADWRHVWTSNGIWDTAFWTKP